MLVMELVIGSWERKTSEQLGAQVHGEATA